MHAPTLTCFTLSLEAQVAHLQLSRPEALNTMGPMFWRELDAALAWLHQGNAARALVISSTGKHFSAGMALDVFGSAISMDDASPEGRAAIADLLGDLQATFTKLETLRIPVIAALHGVVAQRLARRICKECKAEIEVPVATMQDIAASSRKIALASAIPSGTARASARKRSLPAPCSIPTPAHTNPSPRPPSTKSGRTSHPRRPRPPSRHHRAKPSMPRPVSTTRSSRASRRVRFRPSFAWS
mgnify:CR=1 FL=1